VFVCRHTSIACALVLPLCTLMICEAEGCPGEGERRGMLRQQSCTTRDAMLKLHFAAPGAACTHSLALSSSYCIWPRHCVLLAQPVYHSCRHDLVGKHQNSLRRPGQMQVFSPYTKLLYLDTIYIQANSSLEGSPNRKN